MFPASAKEFNVGIFSYAVHVEYVLDEHLLLLLRFSTV